jgi:hypothetical protein
VLARFSKFLVVVALVATTGLHWAVLQSVAWTTMLASNLRTQSLAEAVTHTFDGRHPCCLCKTIAATKNPGRKPSLPFKSKKSNSRRPQKTWFWPRLRAFNCHR